MPKKTESKGIWDGYQSQDEFVDNASSINNCNVISSFLY